MGVGVFFSEVLVFDVYYFLWSCLDVSVEGEWDLGVRGWYVVVVFGNFMLVYGGNFDFNDCFDDIFVFFFEE